MKKRNSMLNQSLLVFALFFFISEYAAAQTLSDNGQARLSDGINLYSQGKWHEALMELRRVEAEAPSPASRGEALFWISLVELSSGEYEEALRDMDALEKTDPENVRLGELRYHRGRVLFHLGRYDEAILLLKSYSDSIVPEGDGSLSRDNITRKSSAVYWIGECLFSMGQMERAGDMFRLVTEEYPASAKYEASVYRLALIDQKKVEAELLGLLRWSHEESLRNMEEYRQRESSYDQALSAYQKRIADMLADTRLQDLEEANAVYREQLKLAEERILSLESALRENSQASETSRESALAERLNAMKTSARELEERIIETGGGENNR